MRKAAMKQIQDDFYAPPGIHAKKNRHSTTSQSANASTNIQSSSQHCTWWSRRNEQTALMDICTTAAAVSNEMSYSGCCPLSLVSSYTQCSQSGAAGHSVQRRRRRSHLKYWNWDLTVCSPVSGNWEPTSKARRASCRNYYVIFSVKITILPTFAPTWT